MKEIRIGNRVLRKGVFDLPYMVAEAGVNHEGSMDRARQMIKEVSAAGADAIKFQAYKAGKLASRNSPAYWDRSKEKTDSQYELFKKYDRFWKAEFEQLADYAKQCRIDFLATPFDEESADFLDPLVPVYKIASGDITTKPLLQHVAGKGKPIFLSTGASTVPEIRRAVKWIMEKNDQIVILHSVLSYPTQYVDANLGAIRHLGDVFSDYIIGYSDHTLPEYADEILISSWLLGAQVIEKHYSWDKGMPGNDHYHSIDSDDLTGIVRRMKLIRDSVGKLEKRSNPVEEASRKYARRSLVAKRRIPKGKIIEQDDLTWKRPGTGIPPWMIDRVVGGEALEDIEEDQILMPESVRQHRAEE